MDTLNNIDIYKFLQLTTDAVIVQINHLAKSIQKMGLKNGDYLLLDTSSKPKTGQLIVSNYDNQIFLHQFNQACECDNYDCIVGVVIWALTDCRLLTTAKKQSKTAL